MRLSGIHDISKRWPKHARNRAIANLANQAKRRRFATNEELREILDRIDKLASYVPKALEAEREYILKGKRYAAEDAMLPCTNHYSDGSKIFPNRTCSCS